MVKISPSILAGNFANLEKELFSLREAGADLVHLDVMDGHYVPNLTFGIPIIKKMRSVSDLPFDVHLMVTNPDAYIDDLAAIGGIEYISYHPETVYHNHRLIKKIQEKGIKAGWAINPADSIGVIEPVIDELDFVSLMSVNPGFSGQSFIPSVYRKLETLKALKINSPKLEIELDGGVNAQLAPSLIEAGVNMLVAGAYVFQSKSYAEAINSLRG